MPETSEELRETVRSRYAAAALAVTTGGAASCGGGGSCGDGGSCCSADLTRGLYDETERAGLPLEAVEASLGCGNPFLVAELGEGRTVLDLGSGGGIDVLLSANRVGPSGKVYGLDMTDEMLDLARSNAAKAGATNVEFLRGRIEAIPLPANTVDVIISNCVINLSTDKPAVFAEAFRVLKPGGHFGVSDIVAEDHITPAERAERGSYVGCIAGALSFAEYREGLRAAGFTDVNLNPTHQAAKGMHSVIVSARKPLDAVA